MSFKILGAVLVIASCGGFGFLAVAAHKREERSLRQMITALEYMRCELKYHLTPLPELCRQAASQSGGAVRAVFLSLAAELENQISPDVERCMRAALCKVKDIPKLTYDAMVQLGRSLGRFDVDGQLLGLEAARQTCSRGIESLSQNREVRLRSYQTLGLCAGAALAILFI